jgi:hypothetical protein
MRPVDRPAPRLPGRWQNGGHVAAQLLIERFSFSLAIAVFLFHPKFHLRHPGTRPAAFLFHRRGKLDKLTGWGA